jgi:hypothetical protein
MNGKVIKPWQAAVIRRALAPAQRYLFRLRQRMSEVGFSQSDTLYQLVCRAYDAVFHLSIELHYLSCGLGVGQASGTASPAQQPPGPTRDSD